MGFLSGVSDAEMSQGGNYIKPGQFMLFVDVLKGITSRKGDDLFVSEFGVLQSTREDQPAGSHVTWMANISKHDAALGNVKACLLGISGIAEQDFTDDDAEDALDEDEQPLHGYFVLCEGTEIETRAGKPFTKCAWRTPTDEQQKEAKKLAKKYGFN